MVIDMGWDVWQQDKYQDGELESIRDVIKNINYFIYILPKRIGSILNDGQNVIVKLCNHPLC